MTRTMIYDLVATSKFFTLYPMIKRSGLTLPLMHTLSEQDFSSSNFRIIKARQLKYTIIVKRFSPISLRRAQSMKQEFGYFYMYFLYATPDEGNKDLLHFINFERGYLL